MQQQQPYKVATIIILVFIEEEIETQSLNNLFKVTLPVSWHWIWNQAAWLRFHAHNHFILIAF